MEKKTLVYVGSGVCVVVLVVIGIVLGVTLTSSDDDDNKSQLEIDTLSSINENTTFPEGSFRMQENQIQSWDDEESRKPMSISREELQQVGIRTDDTSFIAESGRLTFLYIRIPNPPADGTRSKRAVGTLANDIGSIGIKMGDSDFVTVIPLNIAGTNSGLRQVGKLSDSTVYELEARMPELSDCSSSISACFVTAWQPVSLSADGKYGAMAGFSNPMPVSCGTQCPGDGTSNECSAGCSSCDGSQMVSGADTPVTKRFNMGTNNGTFKFYYQTYSVRDRITVRHDDGVIFDTGCVGQTATPEVSFSPAAKGNEIVVSVEPNCQGTTGTAWDFKVFCPEICTKETEGEIIISSGARLIKEGDSVYITANGDMPAVKGTYCGTTPIKWKLEMEKLEVRNYELCPSYADPAGSGWHTAISQSFAIPNGGKAKLSWIDADGNPGSLNFTVKGTQPADASVLAAIGDSPWFARHVAYHESGGRNQFDKKGEPIIGIDKPADPSSTFGVGIFQITNCKDCQKVTCDMVWKWRANVDRGKAMIADAVSRANTWMKDQRKQASAQNNNKNVPVPDRTEARCKFSDEKDSSKKIEDAVAMKIYNSAAKHYCFWDNNKNKWGFVPLNGQNFNYVNRVCSVKEVTSD